MEQGGFYAQPNLRGGGEYGEKWHQAGMFEHKQNVFDDFFAAAQYLVDEKYTSPQRLAIRGRSNGGLLMGAAMTQHPEMFGAIWCGYPLLDMIRFQNFLIGKWWTAEYGSADNRGPVSLPPEVFTLSERETRHEISRHHVQHWRQRYARRSSARAQNDCPCPGR